MYTDGLVESRTRPIDAGLAALRHALGRSWPSPASRSDEASDAVTQELRQHREDDITLVLARIRG